MGAGLDARPIAAEAIADLVERIHRGDHAAEESFGQRYRDGIRCLVRRHSRPHDPHVDDLTQDVVLIVLEHLREGRLANPASLPGYIRSTVVFVTTADYRKRDRRGDTLPIEAATNTATDDDPEAVFSNEQLARRVAALLRHLPVQRDRELLHQFYVLEHSKDDVCRNLGIDPAHFHRVAFRARERMRAVLESRGIHEAE